MLKSENNVLGEYLKNRRAKLDPVALGMSSTRRRTPGLRREEVAQRANVSVTWYTWLEQGRGGIPSVDVLDGIANALALNPAEREHLFLLAQNRPPEVEYRAPGEAFLPQLQRILNSLTVSPALVRTISWDIVAWNRAALAVLANYEEFPPECRNVLRILFSSQSVRCKMWDWELHARQAVAAFAETARAGASDEVDALIDDLRRISPDFEKMWLDHDVRLSGEGVKHMRHSTAGDIAMEYSTFSVDGRPNLSLVIYTAVTKEDEDRIRSLVSG